MATMLIDGTKEEACRTAEANAIRAKTGGSAALAYDFANSKGFADAIAAIPTGGGGNKIEYTRTLTSATSGDVYLQSLDDAQRAEMQAHRSEQTAVVTVVLETSRTSYKFAYIVGANTSLQACGSVYQVGLIQNSTTVVVGKLWLTYGLDSSNSFLYIDTSGNLKLYATKFGGMAAGTYKITFTW